MSFSTAPLSRQHYYLPSCMHKDYGSRMYSPYPSTLSRHQHVPCCFSLTHTHTHTHARTHAATGPMGMSDWAFSCLPFLIRGKSIEDLGLELGLIELCSLRSLIAARSVLSSQHLVHTMGPGGASQRSDRVCGCHREGSCVWLSDLVKSSTQRKGIAKKGFIYSHVPLQELSTWW